MTSREPRAWARLAVRASTVLIPPGPVRDRYRAELEAEQWGMTAREQAGHALSILAGAPALHRALVGSGELTFPHSPWWCRVHLHHRWRVQRTEDGARFRRCGACGLDDDGTRRRSSSTGEAFGMTGVHPN